jgi:hypothetical protein
MPKDKIDYSNTIIYKICCKDECINDIYVGHTTNFTKRKHQHKLLCSKETLKSNIKIYKTIKENGGWDNWDMIEIAKYNCKNATEARIKEQEHFNLLNPSLNTIQPYVNISELYCNICNIQCTTKATYEQHISSDSHKKKEQFSLIPEEELCETKFYCKKCKVQCDFLSDWNKHLISSNHKFKKQNNVENDNINNASININTLSCKKCNKQFQTTSGLWKHKKKCFDTIDIDISDTKYIDTSDTKDMETIKEKAKSITDKDELIMFLIKECTDYKNLLIEQQSMMMKVIENGVSNNTNTNISNNNNNNNNNNKTFNLQVFLNETCKDAMNITDFVNSIKLQLSDLEKLGEVGYVEGISNIITTNLKAMDVTLRPVHCTDKKRETVYVKDENQWTKEDDTKAKLRKAIKRIADKNIRLLPQFREKYPEYSNSSSKISDKYDKMVIEVMTTDVDKEDKIIRNISNATTIEKMINQK